MERPVCLSNKDFCDENFDALMNGSSMECQKDLMEENCSYPHCDFGHSFLKVRTSVALCCQYC